MTETMDESPLVRHLIELARKEDRGALAALRSGLGKRPGEAARMYPYMARFLPAGSLSGPAVEAMFLTASLFATHTDPGGSGSMGTALRRAVAAKHTQEGVERRLTATLDAHPEDLPHHLAGLVSLCQSAGVPIDWYRFERDVRRLLGSDPERRDRIRLQWARDFWRNPNADQTEADQTETEEPTV